MLPKTSWRNVLSPFRAIFSHHLVYSQFLHLTRMLCQSLAGKEILVCSSIILQKHCTVVTLAAPKMTDIYTFSPAELSSERGEKEVLVDSTQLGGSAAAVNAVARELLRSACLPGREKTALEGTSNTTGRALLQSMLVSADDSCQSVAAVTPGHPNQILCPCVCKRQRREPNVYKIERIFRRKSLNFKKMRRPTVRNSPVVYSWYSSLVFTPYWALLLGVPLSFALRLAQHLGVLSTVALAGGYRQVAGGRWYWSHESGATQAEINIHLSMMSALSIYTVLMRTNSPKQPGCLQLI